MADQEAPLSDGPSPGGLYMVGNDLRISNLKLSLSGDVVDTSSLRLEVRTDTWPLWLIIGRQAVTSAEAARAAMSTTTVGRGDAFRTALEQEVCASMTAIAAAAFSIDAFYGSVIELAPSARVQAKSRKAKIAETLRRAFAFKHEQQLRAGQGIEEVFGFRDAAVHPHARFEQPALHPIGLGMDTRYVMFRAENASAAVRFARDVICFCLDHPKPQHADLKAWCTRARALVPDAEHETAVPPPAGQA